MKGAPMSSTVEKMAAMASARRNAWKTRASARSRRPAPSARATADETPAPMPLLVVCRTIITQGNANEAPASALVPMRPRKNPSNVITPANASKLRTFGAARRSSVGKIGPSSRSLVRAAADGPTCLAGAKDGGEIETLPILIGYSCLWGSGGASSGDLCYGCIIETYYCNISIKNFLLPEISHLGASRLWLQSRTAQFRLDRWSVRRCS